jgi:Na+/melibiose symporter-like transporter
VPPAREALPRSLVLWYGLGAVPVGIGVTAGSFLVFYYHQVLAVPASWVGGALLVAALFDAVTDPPVGALSDRTRSRHGRRHPYLFGFALPAALCFYLLWVPPAGLGTAGVFAWLLALLLVGWILDTLITVPHLALGAELSKDYEERTRITTARQILFNVGRAVSGGALLLFFLRPTPEYADGQLNPAGYPPFGALMGLVIAASVLACAWKTRGQVPGLAPAAPPSDGPGPLAALLGEMRQALAHRPFRAVFSASVSKHVAWGTSDALGIFMASYFWKVGTDGLVFWGIGMFAGIFMGLPFWRDQAAKRDKRPIWVLGTTIYLLFFCVPLLLKVVGWWPAEESALYFPLYILTTGFIAHFGAAAHGALHPSMLGDVTDLDELEHGRRREGIIFAAESFGYKALRGFGSLLAGLVVDAVGLEAGLPPEAVEASVSSRLGIAQGLTMFVLVALSLLLIRGYDIDRERHARIRAALAEREAGRARA